MTRALPALMLVAVVGCGSVEIIGRTDASTDPPPELPADGFHDPGTSPALPDWAECNLVDHRGCRPSEWCEFEAVIGPSYDDGCGFEARCTTSEPGTLEAGDECPRPRRMCSPGVVCHEIELDLGWKCYEWCLSDDDCTQPSSVCDHYADFWADDIPRFCGHQRPDPFKLCTLP